MSKPVDQFAFPHPSGAQGCEGMTLRDYFAAKALPAVWEAVMEGATNVKVEEQLYSATALISYKMADAMLRERERGA